MTERVYLDWNATTPLRPEARGAMTMAADLTGNPSSIHAEGRAARRAIETAREQVATLVAADPRNVIFTSGGTEANALALSPGIEGRGSTAPRDRLLISAIEHPSVRAGARFAKDSVEEIPVHPDGVVDLDALRQRLAALAKAGVRRPLVSIMLANNETGAIQPVAEASDSVHEAGGLLHTDAVQAPGRISCDINALGADFLTVSAHKLGGPKGIGALVKRTDEFQFTDPLIRGGGQERGTRAGTENVIGIAGFGAAAEAAAAARAGEAQRVAALRDRLETGLRAISPGAVIFAAESGRLPNTTLFAVPGVKAETALIGLDLEGIAVSSGAACSSGKVSPSHVLAAMGVAADVAGGAIRVSLGFATAEQDVTSFLSAWNRFTRSLPKRAESMAA